MTDAILTFVLCLQVTVVLSQNVTLRGNCSGPAQDEPLYVWGVERNTLTCLQLDLSNLPVNAQCFHGINVVSGNLQETYPSVSSNLLLGNRLLEADLKPTGCSSGELPTQVGGRFMGKPYSMKTEGVLIPGPNNSLIPQLVVTWQPPRTEAGFEHLKGFSLEVWKINEVQGSDVTCTVLDLSSNNFTTQDYKLTFQKKFLQFAGGQDNIYRLELYTLPRSVDSIPKRSYFMLQSEIVGNNTADWGPSISSDDTSLTAPATITVHFSLAPSYYGFKSYTVYLVNEADTRNAAVICDVDLQHEYLCQGQKNQPPPTDATTATLSFYDIAEGTYSVRIQPVDPYWQNEYCLCYQGYHGVDGSMIRNCETCLYTQTGFVFVVGKEKPAALPTTTTSARNTNDITNSLELSSTNNQSSIGSSVSGTSVGMDKSMIVLIAILGVILGLVTVVVVVIFLRRHRRSGGSMFINKSLQQKEALPPSIQGKKTVYLLYTSDHKEHFNVVTKFAIYLTNRCNCKVFFMPWFRGEIQNIGCYEWVISHIDKSDYVLVISSEAAFNLFGARNTNTSFQIEDQGPEIDVFSMAVTHVMTKLGHQDFYKKTILTYFEYTSEEFVLKDINPGIQYKLPKHLKELMCHIHEVNMYTVDPRKLEVESMDNLANNEGRDLQEAITKAKHFEKSKPEWFQEGFYLPHSNRYGQDQGIAESVSLTMSPNVHPDHSYFHYDVYDAKSAITYDTNYINMHPDEIIPPSDVSTTTTAMTDYINTQLHQINFQQSMDSEGNLDHPAGFGYGNYSFSDGSAEVGEKVYASGHTLVDGDTGEQNVDHKDNTPSTRNAQEWNAQETYDLTEDLSDGRDV